MRKYNKHYNGRVPPETIEGIEWLAKHWKISKSAAFRRIIKEAVEEIRKKK